MTHQPSAGSAENPADRGYDVVVVGGGPAGLSAAVVLGRCRRRVLVVDAGLPRNAPAAHSHGFLTRDGAPPAELLRRGRAEARTYGGEFLDELATGVEATDDGFVVGTETGRAVSGRRLLVTTGLVDQLPDIAGVAERWGRDVIHCPFCHGWEARQQRTAVLVNSTVDLHKALLVTQFTDDLTLLVGTDSGDLRADSRWELLTAAGVRVVDGAAAELVVEADRLTGVRTRDGRVVAADILYLSPPVAAPGSLLTALGAATAATPFGDVIAADPTGATSVPGVWAAGNAVDPSAQIVHAASAGYRAAQAIFTSLRTEDLERLSRGRP